MGQTPSSSSLPTPRPSTSDIGTSTEGLDAFANENRVFDLRTYTRLVPNQLPSLERYSALPDELQEPIREGAPGYIFPLDVEKLNTLGNCGDFLKNLEPITANQIDARPKLRGAFREVVIRSLEEFHRRVKRLKLYKLAMVHAIPDIQSAFDRHIVYLPDRDPLCERVYRTLRDVQNAPEMRAASLMDQCKRIVEWKRELGQMSGHFARVLAAYEHFLQNPVHPDHAIPRNIWGPVELFADDPEMWSELGWYTGIFVLGGLEDRISDAENTLTTISERKPHDDALLPEILKSL
jgi:hypothetical protein